MRFAVFLCYSVRYLYVFLCRFAVFVPLYAPRPPPLYYTVEPLYYEHQRDRTKCPLYRGVLITEVGNV